MTSQIKMLNANLEPDGKGYVLQAVVQNDETDTVAAKWTFCLVLKGADGVDYPLDEQMIDAPLPFGRSNVTTPIGGLTRISQDVADGAQMAVTIEAVGTVTAHVENGEAVSRAWAKSINGPDCNVSLNHNGRIVASFWPAS